MKCLVCMLRFGRCGFRVRSKRSSAKKADFISGWANVMTFLLLCDKRFICTTVVSKWNSCSQWRFIQYLWEFYTQSFRNKYANCCFNLIFFYFCTLFGTWIWSCRRYTHTPSKIRFGIWRAGIQLTIRIKLH